TSVLPDGYIKDYGQPYDDGRGYGWVAIDSPAPLDLTANGRERNAVGDQRLDTFIYMQYGGNPADGNLTPGRWEFAVPNGTYDVKVAVGDPLDTRASTNRITVEG